MNIELNQQMKKNRLIMKIIGYMFSIFLLKIIKTYFYYFFFSFFFFFNMNLSGLIQSENLFSVNVQSGTLEEIFLAFNKKIKNHEQRIAQLEDMIKNTVVKDNYQEEIEELRHKIGNCENNVQNLTTNVETLSNDLSEAQKQMNNTLEDRIDETMLSATNMTNQAVSNIQSVVDLLEANMKDFLSRQPKDDFEERVAKLNKRMDLILGENNDNTDFDTRVKNIKDMIYNEMNSRFKTFTDNLDTVLAGDDDTPADASSIAKMKLLLAKMKGDVDEIKKNQQKFGFGGNGDEEEENSLPVYQKNIQRAMIALNETLNKIISEAPGLGEVEYLQLARNAPALFMDDYIASEPDRVGDSKIKKGGFIGLGGRAISDSQNDLLGNVTISQLMKTNLTDDDIHVIALRVDSELHISDLKKQNDLIEKQNQEVLSALERKVDREFDERLFEKFRTYITQLKDAIADVNNRVSDLVTHSELDAVRKIAISIPTKVVDTCAVGRRGPECLFCGRPKTGVVGSISPRVASKLGSAPIATQAGSTMIYGDGQAFQHAAEQSLTRFDILPPITAKTEK